MLWVLAAFTPVVVSLLAREPHEVDHQGMVGIVLVADPVRLFMQRDAVLPIISVAPSRNIPINRNLVEVHHVSLCSVKIIADAMASAKRPDHRLATLDQTKLAPAHLFGTAHGLAASSTCSPYRR